MMKLLRSDALGVSDRSTRWTLADFITAYSAALHCDVQRKHVHNFLLILHLYIHKRHARKQKTINYPSVWNNYELHSSKYSVRGLILLLRTFFNLWFLRPIGKKSSTSVNLWFPAPITWLKKSFSCKYHRATSKIRL